MNSLTVCAQRNICSCMCKHTSVLSPEVAQASQHIKALSTNEKPCLASKLYFSSQGLGNLEQKLKWEKLQCQPIKTLLLRQLADLQWG